MRLVVDTESGSTLHPASGLRGQEWFNPLYEEGDRSGLIGGGLVSACIISASRDREGCGRGNEMKEEEGRERGRQCPGGRQGGATQSAHVPASLAAGDIIYS